MTRNGWNWPEGRPAALSITIDGAYVPTFDFIRNCLLVNGWTATLFVVTGCVGGSLETHRVCTWEQLQWAADAGIEVGSHTVTHSHVLRPWLLYPTPGEGVLSLLRRYKHAFQLRLQTLRARSGVQGPTEFARELTVSKDQLEHVLCCRVCSFAYPYGHCDDRLVKAVQAAGYRSARTTEAGLNLPGRAYDPFRLKAYLWHTWTREQDAQRWLELSLKCRGWLIEVHHLIQAAPLPGYVFQTQPDALHAHLAKASEMGFWIASQAQVVDWIHAEE